MKTLSKFFSTLLLSAAIFFGGCTTLSNLTPTQITAIGTVITQVADEGAVYAIQQDVSSKAYFVAAIPVLDNFANGTDLSPTALQVALSGTSLSTNQWVSLAITAIVTTYDVSYGQYVSNQLTNAPAAKAWISDVELGFKEATGVTLRKGVSPSGVPSFIVKGKVDKSVIESLIKTAIKK